MENRRLWLGGGIAGMLCVVCYILAISISWPDNQLGYSLSLLIVSGFPILGIVYAYALYSFVAEERDSAANRLGFVFMCTAFTTLLAMIVVQSAIGATIGDITRALDAETARALRRGLRMVDLGLDVAWDMLGGTGLIFTGLAIRRRTRLGPGWGIPVLILAIALIGLNAATFPQPPGSAGLIDIGPMVGLFMLALAGRLAYLGWRAPVAAAVPA